MHVSTAMYNIVQQLQIRAIGKRHVCTKSSALCCDQTACLPDLSLSNVVMHSVTSWLPAAAVATVTASQPRHRTQRCAQPLLILSQIPQPCCQASMSCKQLKPSIHKLPYAALLPTLLVCLASCLPLSAQEVLRNDLPSLVTVEEVRALEVRAWCRSRSRDRNSNANNGVERHKSWMATATSRVSKQLSPINLPAVLAQHTGS